MTSKEVQSRCRVLAERISESVHIVDHDPSLALFRLQEHIGKSLPLLNSRKYTMMEVNAALQGACFDLDNITSTVQSMEAASDSLANIKNILSDCVGYKKEIDFKNSQLKKEMSIKRKNPADSAKGSDKT